MLHKEGNKLPQGEATKNYAVMIALALQKSVGGTHRASKVLMRWSGASERTTKNWLSANHGPSGAHLIALARHSPEVQQAIEYLIGSPRSGGSDRIREAVGLLAKAMTLLEAEGKSHLAS